MMMYLRYQIIFWKAVKVSRLLVCCLLLLLLEQCKPSAVVAPVSNQPIRNDNMAMGNPDEAKPIVHSTGTYYL
jgi:endonuclease G